MKIRYPIYNLLHQEVKACADHLLEMSQNSAFSVQKDIEHVLGRLTELLKFASKIKPNDHYSPLCEFKDYIENTMVKYQDEQNRYQTMRLSEVIVLLGAPGEMQGKFAENVVSSLTKYFMLHFQEESQPGRPLFRKLHALKRL